MKDHQWPKDAPAGKTYKCPDCGSQATLGDNAGFHASQTGHGSPYLTDFTEASNKDPVLKFPDSEGYWWMNDPHGVGWETVLVRRSVHNEIIVFRPGDHNAEEIQPWCIEWIKLHKPVIG